MRFIFPDWPVPKHIRALSTTCHHPFNKSVPFDLGTANPSQQAQQHRQDLQQALSLPNTPHWLQQVHGHDIWHADASPKVDAPVADASVTTQPNQVLAILTADCLPILLCHPHKHSIAAIHAGWRGLYKNIIAKTCQTLPYPAEEYYAWIGPSICQRCYAVDHAFKERFCNKQLNYTAAFHSENEHIFANLQHIACLDLMTAGLSQYHVSNVCTAEESHCHSYRRNKACGRMATLIWISAE